MVIPFPKPASVVIVYLKEPRERFWGLVRSLDATGLVVQGVDLDSFDDCVRQIVEARGAASLSLVFFPLLRIEKILADTANGAIPAMHDHFMKRVGRSLEDLLGVQS
jgi:hypothetical protein